MTLDYFYGQSGELFSYFRIPKALFQDCRFRQLSTDARTLYGILLDRMSLSASMVSRANCSPISASPRHCSKTAVSGSSPPMPGRCTAFCWTA